MIRKNDLSIPYRDSNGKWVVEETLYPESRGYIKHVFDTQDEAEQFIEKAKCHSRWRKLSRRG